MFKSEGVTALGTRHRETFRTLVALQRELNSRFYGIEEAVEALILSVAAGEALLLIGPPGTAKSRLVRAFCHCVGLLKDQDMVLPQVREDRAPARPSSDRQRDYFEYLLTQFTEPGELFGFYDLAALQSKTPKLVRDDTGMMQHARIVFLDEVFNASSAILNSLLAFMNERKFHDRGTTSPVALEYLVGATNDVPTTPELRAFFDRFLVRTWVDVVPPDHEQIRDLLTVAWRETHSPPLHQDKFVGLLDKLRAFRASIEEMTRTGALVLEVNPALAAVITDDVKFARSTDISKMSNRRLVGFSKVILVHALLRWARAEKAPSPRIEEIDLKVLLRFGVDRQGEELDRRFASVTT
jgi:MoxR-like ATPase